MIAIVAIAALLFLVRALRSNEMIHFDTGTAAENQTSPIECQSILHSSNRSLESTPNPHIQKPDPLL